MKLIWTKIKQFIPRTMPVFFVPVYPLYSIFSFSISLILGMVTAFCKRLGWLSIELLVSQFHDRIQFGIQRELCDLMRLDQLNGPRARALFNAGLTSIPLLAAADWRKTLFKIQCRFNRKTLVILNDYFYKTHFKCYRHIYLKFKKWFFIFSEACTILILKNINSWASKGQGRLSLLP